jgi:hypothetical protein
MIKTGAMERNVYFRSGSLKLSAVLRIPNGMSTVLLELRQSHLCSLSTVKQIPHGELAEADRNRRRTESWARPEPPTRPAD